MVDKNFWVSNSGTKKVDKNFWVGTETKTLPKAQTTVSTVQPSATIQKNPNRNSEIENRMSELNALMKETDTKIRRFGYTEAERAELNTQYKTYKDEYYKLKNELNAKIAPIVIDNTLKPDSNVQITAGNQNQTLGDKAANFFKVTLPTAAQDAWDDIKYPIAGASAKQLLTESKLSPELLKKDAEIQLAKEDPRWRDYTLIKPTKDIVEKYGMEDSNIKAISGDNAQLLKDLERAEKTYQASPIDATVANAGAAGMGILGDVAGFANMLGADEIPVVKDLTASVINTANKLQANAQQYNVGTYGGYMGNLTQVITRMIPYFIAGTGKAVVEGGKAAKLIASTVNNPSFWISLTTIAGQKYNENMANGVNRWTATLNALTTAIPSALIEIAGGVGAKGKEAQSLLTTILEENFEEIAQGIVEKVSDKLTTKPDMKLYSTTEEAIINPKQMGEEVLYTTPATLLTGGASRVIQNSQTAKLNKEIEEMHARYQTKKAMDDYKQNSQYAKYQPQQINTQISSKDIKPRAALPEGGKIYVDPQGVAVDSRNYVAPSENNVQNNNYSPVNARQVIQNPINQENVEKIENQQKNVAPESSTNDFQEQGKQTILPTQKIQETVNSAKIVGMSDFDVKKAQDIHKMLQSGSNLKFYDSKNVPAGVDSRAINANGFYKDGTLWINKDSKRQVEKILGHELTHHLENTKEYSNFAKTIFDSNLFYDYITSQGYDNVEQFKENLRQRGYSDKDMDYEMVSMFAEDNLFDSQEKINRLARENRTLAQKILNWLSDMKTKLVGTSQEKELLRIENMYRKALEQSRGNEQIDTKVAGEGPAFSLSENQEQVIDRLNKEYDLYMRTREDLYNRRDEVEKQYFDKINSQEYKDADKYVKSLKDTNEILNSKEYQVLVEAERLKKKVREYQEEIDIAYQEMTRIAEAIDKEEKSHRTPEKAIKQAKKTFGTTSNFNEAGYLLVDGSLLDFSGKNQGGPSGRRTIDHREINEVGYDMDEFIDIGNIRLKPESNGFELMHEPTEKQYATLKKYIDNANGEVYIDIHKGNKMSGYETKKYPENTPASKIISDLQYYYKNGEFPYESELQQFRTRFSLPDVDNQGRKLSAEQQEFFKDSKVRDEDGKLLEVYHGTNAKEFTVFDKELSDEDNVLGQGLYFTSDKAEGKKYGEKIYSTYLNIKKPFIIDDLSTSSLANKIKELDYDADIMDYDYGVASTTKMTDYLIDNGYDGIKAGKNVYVAFEPNQIKNVDNTNPTGDADIRYSIDGKEETRTSKTKSSLLDEIAPINESKLEDVEEEKVANILTRTPKTKAKDMLKQSKDVLMRKLVDAGHTIDTVGKITGDKHLYQYFNNTKQARQSAEYMIGEAQTDIQGNRIGNSLIRVFEPIRAKGDEYTNKFFEYLLHMHNIDRMKQNKPVFGKSVTAEDSSLYVKELLKEYPEFEKAANKVYAYNRNLMQWRVDSGLISQEQADIMNEMYPHYVPTFRNVSGTAGSRVLQGGVQVANTVRKATGSNKDILPIDASMARQTMQTVQAAKRNLLGNRLLNDVLNNKEKVAEYVQAVEKTSEKTNLAEEMDNSKDSNLDLNNTFKIFRNGETYLMRVNNGIYEGLKSISSEIDNTDTNVLLKPVKAANNMFKKLITGYSPMFTIKNFARDIQDSGLYAKELRKFIKNYPKTYTEMLGDGKMWQLYKSLGGTGSSFFDYDSGIEKAIDSKNKLGTKIKESTVGKIEQLNMMIEQAPRFAEFMSTIEKAGNQNYDTLMEAMLNAADITVNFGRSGTWGNFLNSTFVPFFNPSIQGFDKMGRTFLEGKSGKQFAKLAIRATLLGIAPTLINELLLGDDDDYENLSDRDKDTNFIIKLGDNKWLKIPKGRVLSIFGNTASRVLKTMRGEEWDVGEFVKNQLDQTAPISPFESNIVSPIMAVQNNKTWYGSKIVPQRLEGYAPKDQYDEKTDAFSKWLGGKINYSPKKINYLIDAYTGIIGDVALPLTTPKAETNPFTKAFVIDGVTNNEISNDFYNMLDEYNPKQNDKKSAKEVTRYLNKQSTQVNEVNKQIREIENSDLSNAEKKKQVRELRELINTIELTAMATVPQYEKAVDKYKGTFADEEVDSDYAYLFANRDIFGAEYAVKTFSKSLYNNHKDENMEKFFRNYFTREYFQKKLEPEKKSTNALPTLSNKTNNTRQLPKLSNNQNKQLPKLQK